MIPFNRHEELLAMDGLYSDMWLQQLQGDPSDSKSSEEEEM